MKGLTRSLIEAKRFQAVNVHDALAKGHVPYAADNNDSVVLAPGYSDHTRNCTDRLSPNLNGNCRGSLETRRHNAN